MTDAEELAIYRVLASKDLKCRVAMGGVILDNPSLVPRTKYRYSQWRKFYRVKRALATAGLIHTT